MQPDPGAWAGLATLRIRGRDRGGGLAAAGLTGEAKFENETGD